MSRVLYVNYRANLVRQFSFVFGIRIDTYSTVYYVVAFPVTIGQAIERSDGRRLIFSSLKINFNRGRKISLAKIE